MAHRFFNDANGVEWQVCSTIPASPSAVAAPMAAGWLTFLSPVGRKRLVPIPAGWKDMADAQLAHWCAEAHDTPMHEKRLSKQGLD